MDLVKSALLKKAVKRLMQFFILIIPFGFRVGRLKYIQVGPFRKEGMHVGVIKHQGPAAKYNGLLGINFLLGVDYKIDYFNQIIRWEPRQSDYKGAAGATESKHP